MNSHPFGGTWTEKKLQKVREYLNSYLTALKKQPFKKIYIDGYAGTGYRRKHSLEKATDLPFEDFEIDEMNEFMDGSAKIALQFNPGFDQYIFIENDPNKCEELEKLRIEFPNQANKIEIWQRDSNEALIEFCGDKTSWKNQRAVLFLDPYGLQVSWTTIECIAATKGIDLWYLFPLGAVFRLLPHKGALVQQNKEKLDSLFGTHDWYDNFYSQKLSPGLFEDETDMLREADINVIKQFLLGRLEIPFPKGVAKNPTILRNSKKSPMFLLCFAVSNPKAKDLALRMANHILREEHV